MKTTPTILLSAIALTASSLLATAQEKPAAPPNPSERGNRGTPEEWRARMEEGIKTALKVTNDEWTVLQPLIEKVTTKQREAMSGRFGGMFGGRGGGPGGDRGGAGGGAPGNAPGGAPGSDRPGSAERQALRDALEKDGTTAEDIKAKLNAVREFQKKSAAELATAREELKKVVTVRQEAVLFSMGILE